MKIDVIELEVSNRRKGTETPPPTNHCGHAERVVVEMQTARAGRQSWAVPRRSRKMAGLHTGKTPYGISL